MDFCRRTNLSHDWLGQAASLHHRSDQNEYNKNELFPFIHRMTPFTLISL
jgi:hypothetical protein